MACCVPDWALLCPIFKVRETNLNKIYYQYLSPILSDSKASCGIIPKFNE